MPECHILFVCTGNTCRSPMAEALARRMLAEAAIGAVCGSAGVSAAQGQPASAHAQRVMALEGLSLSAHRARMADAPTVTQAALVLTMTRGHRDALRVRYPAAADKVYTLAEYAGDESEVLDPYGLGEADYADCARQIKQLLAACVEKIRICAQ